MTESEKKSNKKGAADPTAAVMALAKAAINKHTQQKPLLPGSTAYDCVSTGSFNVDMLIGGTPRSDGKGLICPGFPNRRITEVFGPESSGKTTLALSAIAQAQKAGGTGMLLDFEHSIDLAYAQKIGVSLDPNKMLVYQPPTMEDGFKMILIGIQAGIDIIVVDSVAAMMPKSEMEKGLNDVAAIGAVARKFSFELPKIVKWLHDYPSVPGEKRPDTKRRGTALVLINQIRASIAMNAYGGGNDENTSGGKALKFYAYERLRMQRVKSEFVERQDRLTGKKKRFPYGNVTDVKVVKSKIDAKQGHSTQIFIRYGTGIDDYYSVIETGVTQKMIKKDGGYYTFEGQRYQGKEKLRAHLIANTKSFQELRRKLVDAVNAEGTLATEDLEEGDVVLEETGDVDLENVGLDAVAEEIVQVDESETKDGAPEANAN